MSNLDFSILLPEIVLAIYAMLALLVGVFTGKDRSAPLLVWVSAAVMVALAVWIGLGGGDSRAAFGGMFMDDAFARFSKVAILISAAAALVMSENYMARHDLLRFEYPVLVALATVGMMVMVSAGDLMVLYMGLELQSLSLYVVASLRRDSPRSTEAGLKYFVLGALSSGMLLYGATLVYGFAGTTRFDGIISVATEGDISLGLLFGLVFMITGLAFKVSAVPFHMWTPDVYEGAPTPVAAFFATAPKMAAMALFARVMHDAFGNVISDWGQVVAVLSVASLLLGAIAAVGQRNIKRLMAYSSIGHVGYALIGLAAGTEEGVRGVLIYMAIYVVMNIGTFACILSMRHRDGMVEDIYQLAGLSKTRPYMALAFLLFMFSLAGIPPLAGFFGKFYIFVAAINAGLVPLAVIGLVTSVVGAYYYLRIVKIIYFDDAAEGFEPSGRIQSFVMTVAGIFVALFVVFPGPLLDSASAAAAVLFP